MKAEGDSQRKDGNPNFMKHVCDPDGQRSLKPQPERGAMDSNFSSSQALSLPGGLEVADKTALNECRRIFLTQHEPGWSRSGATPLSSTIPTPGLDKP